MLRALSLSRTHLRSTAQAPCFLLPLPFSTLTHHSKRSGGRDEQFGVVSYFNRDPVRPPRLFLVQPRLRPPTFLKAKLNEALCLANSLEEQRDGYFDTDFFEKDLPPHVIVQNPLLRSSKPRADTYFGPGTVQNLKCHLNDLESKEEIDAVFVNTILSGIQQRNLERAWEKPVLDRVGLIIEIFNAHAHTKEARLQAELAALMYKKSRLVRVRGLDGRYTFGETGEAEVVSARGRGSGGRGFISGAGETELQLQRRRILDRRTHLLAQIEEVRRTRALQRAARKKRGGLEGQGLATVAVVGYTNAGKSTLISALSDSYVYSDARLFATLDARLRGITLPSGRRVLLSDTVGFISDLPIQLVEAFHSTLEEVVEADLLVHVIDSSAPNLHEHRDTVLKVLQQIGVSEEKLQNMIEVWNKIDYEEVGDDEHLDNYENAEFSDFPEVEDSKTDCSTQVDDDDDNDVAQALLDVKSADNSRDGKTADDYSSLSRASSGDLEEIIDDKQDGYTDDWLLSGDDSVSADDYWNSLNDQQNEPSNTLKVEKESQSQAQQVPHVRVSALMGVGLQELLELVDERLKVQEKKLKSYEVVEDDIFTRKWRPPQKEDDDVAVQQ